MPPRFPAGLSDAELLERTADGDADAFAAFFRRHQRAVRRFALHRCSNSDDAADLESATFDIAWRRAAYYKPSGPSASVWLIGIALKVFCNQGRSHRRYRRTCERFASSYPRFEGSEQDRIIEAIDAKRLEPRLSEALQRLSKRQREALLLHARDGLEPREIADVLKVTKNAARLLLYWARKKMQKSMGDAADALDDDSDFDIGPEPHPTT